MKNQTNWIVGISDGNLHEYKIGNVTFTVFSEFQPKISLEGKGAETIARILQEKQILCSYGVLAEQGTASWGQKDTAESVQMVQDHSTEDTRSA